MCSSIYNYVLKASDSDAWLPIFQCASYGLSDATDAWLYFIDFLYLNASYDNSDAGLYFSALAEDHWCCVQDRHLSHDSWVRWVAVSLSHCASHYEFTYAIWKQSFKSELLILIILWWLMDFLTLIFQGLNTLSFPNIILFKACFLPHFRGWYVAICGWLVVGRFLSSQCSPLSIPKV